MVAIDFNWPPDLVPLILRSNGPDFKKDGAFHSSVLWNYLTTATQCCRRKSWPSDLTMDGARFGGK